MKRTWTTAVSGVLLAASAALGQADAGGKYRSAGIAQAGDIAYPINSQTPGIVTLDVGLDAIGAVQNVVVVRDLPPFTSAAQSAVRSWQFTPAMVDGQSVAGTARVNVVFNPYNPGGVGLPGGSLPPANNSGGTDADFQPAQLQKAGYAAYPQNTVASGTVVLQVHVGSEGNVRGAVVVRGKGALSAAATNAVKAWMFAPASYKGKVVGSEIVVAFVFALPAAGTM
jgi:TonB family protein